MSKTTVLNTYNTLIVSKCLYGSENWTLTASQRRIIEAVEMKLLRSLAGYNLHDHKTKDFICRELKITGILDTIDEYRLNWHLHLQRMPQNRIRWNHTTTDNKERKELEVRRNVGVNSCNSGDGTDQTGSILDVDDDESLMRISVTCSRGPATCFHPELDLPRPQKQNPFRST